MTNTDMEPWPVVHLFVNMFRAELSGRVKLSARGITIELSRKVQHDNFISMARQKACTF